MGLKLRPMPWRLACWAAATLLWLAALAALALAQVRQADLIGVRALALSAQAALARPALLSSEHRERLEALRSAAAAQELRSRGAVWLVGAAGRTALYGEVHARAAALRDMAPLWRDLQALLKDLADEPGAALGEPAFWLQALRADDGTATATATATLRLRGVLEGRRLMLAAVPSWTDDASLKRLAGAVAALDNFHRQRDALLTLLHRADQQAAAAVPDDPLPGLAWAALCSLLAAVASLLATVWPRGGPVAAHDAAPTALVPMPASAAPPPEALAKLPVVSEALTLPQGLPTARPEDEVWRDDLRMQLRQACHAGHDLALRVQALSEAPPDEPLAQAQEALEQLRLLTTVIERSREGTLNLALALARESGDDDRVASVSRLDQCLRQGVEDLARLQHLHSRLPDPAGMTSAVARRDLVALHADLQHLVAQLQALPAELDLGPPGVGMAHHGAADGALTRTPSLQMRG
jgi:hypothetical protein